MTSRTLLPEAKDLRLPCGSPINGAKHGRIVRLSPVHGAFRRCSLRSLASGGHVALLLAALLIGGFLRAPAARAAACDVPVATERTLPAGPAATPAGGAGIIQVEGTPKNATPASLPPAPAATPIATLPATDSSEILTADLTAVSEAMAACLSAGDAKTVAKLGDPRYLGQLFGSSVPLAAEDYIAIGSELTPVPTRILRLENATQTADDRATATVTQVVGNQLMVDEWTFERVAPGDRPANRNPWMIRSERSLPVAAPRNASAIEVAIGDTSYTLNTNRVAGPSVVLHGNNVSGEDHEMLVLKLTNGFTTKDLLAASGPDLPANALFIGEIPLRGGHEADLVLVDLDPGTYTIVCLFPNADGVPYLADGMEATFTVEES